MPDAGNQPKYRLTLRPLPGAVPVWVRLRRLLKALLRGYGFRCIDVREIPAGPGPPHGEVAPSAGACAPARPLDPERTP